MRGHGGPGGEAGPFIRHQGGCGLARLLVTLGTRDAGGAAAVDARGSVTVAARTRRGAAGAATASPWAAGRRWAILLALGWLVQVGLRVWFSRHQVRDEAVTIAGQLCTPKDVLARRVRVPSMNMINTD